MDSSLAFGRAFADAPARAWRAMADPAQVVRWWGPRGCFCTIQRMEVRPGGAWDYVLHAWGANVLCRAVFEDVAEGERLVFRQDDFVASWVFAADGPGTALAVDLRFATVARRDAMARNRMMMNGAEQSLDRLAEWLGRAG
jgi:uncharacterized protein YndB with AHSA1/START domain